MMVGPFAGRMMKQLLLGCSIYFVTRVRVYRFSSMNTYTSRSLFGFWSLLSCCLFHQIGYLLVSSIVHAIFYPFFNT